MKHLNENLTHKFVKRGSWLYLFAFLTGPIGYAIKIIISHDLSVPELGILYGVLSFILLIGSLNDLGMVESLKFFVPKFLGENNLKKAKAFFVYGGTAMLVMSLFTSLVLYSAANWLSEVYFRAPEAAMILQVFSIYLLISNIQHYFSAVFLIFQNTKFSQGLEVIRLAVSLGFAAQAFFVGHGNLEFYTGIWNYGTLVASIIGGWFVWKLHLKELFLQVPFEFSRDDFGELFTYSTWALLASNATFILSQVDMQMLLLMKGPSETGIYSNYLSLIAIPFIVLTPIIGFIFPVASSYFGANQPEKIRTIATVFSRIFVLLWLMVMGMCILYAGDLWTFFFGEKFARSGEILYWSIGFIIFNFLLQVNFNLLAAIGQVRKRLQIVLVWLVCNICFNAIGIYYAGAAGSALAVGASWAIIWYLSASATKEYHSSFAWKIFLKNASIFSILTGILWFAPRHIEQLWKLGFLLSLFLSGIAFALTFAYINRDDISRIIQTLKKPSTWIQ